MLRKPLYLMMLVPLLLLASAGVSVQAESLSAEAQKGRELATSRKMGNCLACHQMGDADQPGNVGPPLQNIQARYPNKQDVYDRIWDPMKFNPIVSMPPFGRNRILTDEQIRLITEYVYTL